MSLSSGAPTVRVRDLDHHFGEAVLAKQVLFDIALDVLPGEMTIMTGPSGSGKTTLMTLIGALRAAQSGSVVVLGRELRGLDQAALVETRRNIGFIYQHHGLFEIVTHDNRILDAADRIVSLVDGRMVSNIQRISSMPPWRVAPR